MSYPYHGYKNISSQSVQERILAATDEAVRWLQQNGDASLLKETLSEFLDDEMYEFAEGITKAIEMFEKNPQLSL